jgi:hypothetical protein
MLRHGLITAAFSCAIAAALSIAGGGRWAPHLVYSLSIGLLSWLFIDTGRLLATRHRAVRWPPGPWGWAIVAVGATLGFLGGNLIGDAWVGAPAFDFLDLSGRKLATGVIVTLAATIGLCLFFYGLGRSRHLQGEVDQARRAATEARLRLLETQLEPHMLFNTLANLRVLVTLDPPSAVAMLDRLDRYLRMTLGGSRAPMHPLAAEFDRLDDYLGLMAVRMGERLRYALTLPEALRDVPVPPMLLQPLVENAIRHGLEPRVEGGRIDVRARRAGDRLVIEVSDTGVGLDAAVPSDGGGFGLAQVRERLAAVYGDRALLDLAPSPDDDGGTRATLSVPLPARH